MTESLIINAGGVLLSPAACAALLDVVTPDRDAALDADGTQAARAIRHAGTHWVARRAALGTINTTARGDRSRSTGDQLLDVEQAAEYLGASPRAVRGWAADGHIGTKVGKYWIFTFPELDAFARRDQ